MSRSSIPAAITLLILACAPVLAQDAAKPFRVLVPGAGLNGCAAAGDAEAYRAHLEQRLTRPVTVCGAADAAAAAAALAAGQADMVALDPVAFVAVKDEARAILAGRIDAATGRVVTVALVTKRSGKTRLTDLEGASPIVAGRLPASKDVPMKALADAGAPIASFKPLQVIEGDEPAFAALRAGRGDLLVVTASARQRACMTPDIKVDPCADLTEIWRGRPIAPRAMVVANAMPIADRHQLVGIHIALHFEAPKAMAFMARALPPAVALDPAEAGALLAGRR
jgi:ABC-type phosphate/phosphonate transport system substrate-binding protein